MLKNSNLRSRLLCVTTILSLLLLATGGYGVRGIAQANAALRSVYDDRLAALGHLEQVARAGLHTQLQLALASDAASAPAALQAVQATLERERMAWDAYMATALTPEETLAARHVAALRTDFATDVLAPALAALRAHDYREAARILRGPMQQRYPQVQQAMSALIDMQLVVAKAACDHAQADYIVRRAVSLAAMALGLLMAAMAAWRHCAAARWPRWVTAWRRSAKARAGAPASPVTPTPWP